MCLDVDHVRSVRKRSGAESHGFIDCEPSIAAKSSERFTKAVGARVARIMSESLAEAIDRKVRDLVWVNDSIVFGDAVYDLCNVVAVSKVADQIRRNSLAVSPSSITGAESPLLPVSAAARIMKRPV